MTHEPIGRPIEVIQARKPKKPAKSAIPDGSVSEVLEWVGDDAERASAALKHEEGTRGRKTLVSRLNELTDDDASAISTFEAEGGPSA